MLVTFTSINPTFLSLTNIGNALTFTVELGLIARVGQARATAYVMRAL